MGDYYKKKAKVKKIIDCEWAQLKVIGTGDYVQVHQSKLQTVVPVFQLQ